MKILQYLAILLTGLIVISCQSKNAPAADTKDGDKAVTEKVTSPLKAREANRYEFVESEILSHPEDEKGFNHLYMGSLDGFDYISVRSNKYRIPIEQLELDHNFPLTQDAAKWVPMRIHFSHVKYK
jgi:hypothetical protein